MERKENWKKENDKEERWHARMDKIEAMWKTKIAETQLEYLTDFMQMTKK